MLLLIFCNSIRNDIRILCKKYIIKSFTAASCILVRSSACKQPWNINVLLESDLIEQNVTIFLPVSIGISKIARCSEQKPVLPSATNLTLGYHIHQSLCLIGLQGGAFKINLSKAPLKNGYNWLKNPSANGGQTAKQVLSWEFFVYLLPCRTILAFILRVLSSLGLSL